MKNENNYKTKSFGYERGRKQKGFLTALLTIALTVTTYFEEKNLNHIRVSNNMRHRLFFLHKQKN
ncbi:Hypothetical protein I595_3310 [Croceitalea dokdonensis DOKDO 023]|uniref:Uncharacterized protein n=1 Tax=Croceitalea dokdonensis DOKDO 023 TaxID=1300341 RepID=A0A0P7ARJ0_9FLAO|nr:Hypothetical protein I595_3310 [Croceitalea dokdonensis DOKDO 023]